MPPSFETHRCAMLLRMRSVSRRRLTCCGSAWSGRIRDGPGSGVFAFSAAVRCCSLVAVCCSSRIWRRASPGADPMERVARKCRRHLRRRSAIVAAAVLIALSSIIPSCAQNATPPAPPPAPAAATCLDQPEMTFTAWTSALGQTFGEGAREYIFADGFFCPDTDQKFQQFLNQNPPKAPNTIVVLNSGGGDVAAGLAMGRIIRQAKMWTQVGSRFPLMIGGNQNIPPAAVPFLTRASSPPFPGYCYSSCTFTFMGGVNRWIDYDSNYGVHRFEFDGSVPNPVDQAQIDSATLVEYIEEMGISPNYMVEMVKQGGDNVTNLSMKVLQQLNIVTPRWATSWQIAPLSDNSGFYLD